MAPKLKRPILVGGVGLATGLWLMESLGAAPMDGGGFGLTGILALSAGAWWLQRRSVGAIDRVPEIQLPQMDRALVEGAIAQAQQTLSQLAAETTSSDAPALGKLTTQIDQLNADLNRQELRLALLGGQAVGKTTLANVLAQQWRPKGIGKIRFMDTPQLFAVTLAETHSSPLGSAVTSPGHWTGDWAVPESVLGADLTLFVTAGDVTDTERRCLAWLKPRVARLIVVVNKQDQQLPEQQSQILSQVRQNLKEILPTGDVVAIAAQPAPIRFISANSNSTATPSSSLTSPAPAISLLLDRLDQLTIAEPPQQLIWATVCHSANALTEEAKTLLNQLRRQRASKVIEQYQWVSAGAAFINPVPTLDLLATAAVNSQLILDLSKIYRQPLSPDHAKTMATTLAEMLIKLGLVEVSSKLLGIALKSNGATFVAGGLIQGASAAYLTRTVGNSLMDYFEVMDVTGELPESQSLEQLKQMVQKAFQASRQSPMLQSFAKQALQKLKPETVAETVPQASNGTA